jgi:hypothetical protein
MPPEKVAAVVGKEMGGFIPFQWFAEHVKWAGDNDGVCSGGTR